MRASGLVPITGAWVRRRGDDQRFGRVVDREIGPQPRVLVEWLPEREREWLAITEVRSGLHLAMDVQDVPRSRVRKALGEGEVSALRTIGGRDQALVDFPASGLRVWLPYENLRQVRGVRHSFLVPTRGNPGDSERVRLRLLAHAIDLWNESTGALSRLDIDPLPHQIHLVHHILASGNLNWLIADDVGLGKTIEVGMLLAALDHRRGFRRILVVAPAGLTRQWQEELHQKFGMSDYRIYGSDFLVQEPRHWKLYDKVIASVDLLKAEPHIASVLAAEPWDLVIFDEAHRLTRRQWGSRIEASDRFRLAAALRQRTDSMLLLSATPHQGMPDRFEALLELLRPELVDEIRALSLNPDILREMVIRNQKSDVTDAQGRFVFRGKTTRAIPVALGEESRRFDRALRDYLRRGYEAGRRLGRTGITIGFVMTVYRKLAASSSAAILGALERRRARLMAEIEAQPELDEAPDDRFQGEWEELLAGSAREFFRGELEMLDDLLEKARLMRETDRKVQSFIEGLLGSVLAANCDEKILIFTEYRATQDYLAESLAERFGAEKVALIHGSLGQADRRASIAHFEGAGQFLISTEAGGEGINLQHRCHVMVNFDLPWNPMRLVQRIGRLYRYGQQQRVVVFNVHAPQTIDAEIIDLMYARIDRVVQDMAVLGGEFNPGLAEDILGEMADVLDVEQILDEASEAGIERTRESIDAALRRAREAVAKQRDLFAHVAGFDPGETRDELVMAPEHLRSFVEGMLDVLGIEVVEQRHDGLVWALRLPDEVVQELPSRRSRIQVTLDRVWGSARSDIEMLDVDSPLMQLMLERARAHDFGPRCGAWRGVEGEAFLAAILRWQNDQGRRMRQELVVAVADGQSATVNGPGVVPWLAVPAVDGHSPPGQEAVRRLYRLLEASVDARLANGSSVYLHPENRQWVAGGWGERESD